MDAVRDRVMGTDVLLAGLSPRGAAAALTALRRVEAVFSRFRPDSETSRVNASAGTAVAVSPLFRHVVARACAHQHESDGLFSPFLGTRVVVAGYDRDFSALSDGAGATTLTEERDITVATVRIDHVTGTVTVPEGVAIDLGGFVKGWAVQRVADELAASGEPRGLVDAGGDLAAWRPAGTPPWRVGVRSTHATLVLPPRAAVATSSTVDRRWRGPGGDVRHHVVDPRTGAPADTGRVQATVVHAGATADLAAAEVEATCALLRGPSPGPGTVLTVADTGRVRVHDPAGLVEQPW